MDERKRESIVAYLRRRMEEFGIEAEDIAASISADQKKLQEARYRDAHGNIWDGVGSMPRWVIQATSAGQSLEHFAIATTDPRSDKATAKKPKVDWRNDPFAGSRLATQNDQRVGAS